jgi:hypothetical protein
VGCPVIPAVRPVTVRAGTGAVLHLTPQPPQHCDNTASLTYSSPTAASWWFHHTACCAPAPLNGGRQTKRGNEGMQRWHQRSEVWQGGVDGKRTRGGVQVWPLNTPALAPVGGTPGRRTRCPGARCARCGSPCTRPWGAPCHLRACVQQAGHHVLLLAILQCVARQVAWLRVACTEICPAQLLCCTLNPNAVSCYAVQAVAPTLPPCVACCAVPVSPHSAPNAESAAAKPTHCLTPCSHCCSKACQPACMPLPPCSAAVRAVPPSSISPALSLLPSHLGAAACASRSNMPLTQTLQTAPTSTRPLLHKTPSLGNAAASIPTGMDAAGADTAVPVLRPHSWWRHSPPKRCMEWRTTSTCRC